MNCVRRLLEFFGVDRAIGYSTAQTGWNLLSRPLTLMLTIAFLSPEELGFLYTFGSLAALQVFFELGLGQVIQAVVSHESARLELMPNGDLVGIEDAKYKVRSIFQQSTNAYYAMSAMMFLLVYPAGCFFLLRTTEESSSWMCGWILTILGVVLNLINMPRILILGGCGLVADVIRINTFHTILGTISFWILLVCGLGLLAHPLSTIFSALIRNHWIASKWKQLFFNLKGSVPENAGINWRTQIWALHWRFAISWLSGYFIFQMFVPLTFAFHGSVAAGKLGLSMSIFALVQGIGYGWISTKLPTFGRLIAKKDFITLDRMFYIALIRSTVIVFLGCSSLMIIVGLLHYFGFPIADRFISIPLLGILALTTLAQHLVSSMASYLRAYRDEPFMWNSIVAAILSIPSTYLLCKFSGVSSMLIGFFIITMTTGLMWGAYIFVNKRKFWQLSGPSIEGPSANSYDSVPLNS